MPLPHPDTDLPVPDPEGSPIHPRELAAAENRMLDDMHGDIPLAADTREGDVTAAQASIDRQNSREMSEDEAADYRLAPDNLLDWLDTAPRPEDAADDAVLTRWENHLDWLEEGDHRPVAPSEDDPWQERD